MNDKLPTLCSVT